jgi:hypothetical protein
VLEKAARSLEPDGVLLVREADAAADAPLFEIDESDTLARLEGEADHDDNGRNG